MVQENKGISYCALCAWRRDCQLKYRFQDSPALYCKEYTRDVTIKIDETQKESGKENGRGD